MTAPLGNDQILAIHRLITGTETISTRPTLMLAWQIDQCTGRPAAHWEVAHVRTGTGEPPQQRG
jgi:hypothetical protein